MSNYIVASVSAALAVASFATGNTVAGMIWTANVTIWTIRGAAEMPLGRVPVLTPIWEGMRDGIETALIRADGWISRKINR